LFILICCSTTYAHNRVDSPDYPEIGKKCPDVLLRNIVGYSKKQAKLSEFQGKWLILDFWNEHCGGCIISFPRTNEMQKKYGDKVQFMLVADPIKYEDIKVFYAKWRERKKFEVPCAFDTLLAPRFDVEGDPYIIVIDPLGIVRSLTRSINATDLQGFLSGNPPALPYAPRAHENKLANVPFKYDFLKPLLIDGNGGNDTDFVYRTVISKWDLSKYYSDCCLAGILDTQVKKGIFQMYGMLLSQLYCYAYFGRDSPPFDSGFYEDPIWEVADTSVKVQSAKYGKNMYSYSLIVRPALSSKHRIMQMMQRDLNNYFNFKVAFEKRSFPSWKLIATDEARKKLKTKGGPYYFKEIPGAGYTARNMPALNIIRYIELANSGIFLDESGLTGNIDITLDYIRTDLADIRKGLQANGLDLVPGFTERMAMVIRDAD